MTGASSRTTEELVLVTGGTGTLGREVVSRLANGPRNVRVLTRQTTARIGGAELVVGDLATGAGVDAALEGASVIVHCAGTSKGDQRKAANLVRAAARAGAPHLVFISVVGCDRVAVRSRIDRMLFGYFASKLAAEQAIADSGLPWTTLRATQFHDLIYKTAAQMARMPVIVAPRSRFQPIDTGEVADRLVELASNEPAGVVPEMAGPKAYELADLVRSYLHAHGKRRPLVSAPLPGQAARTIRDGANLSPDRAVGQRTWEEFLAERTR